ncbi:MAG: helix-turn-helix domain-containing protein [Parvibaculum sp.]|nr:helix-turn-helix domain-containing protein [Parvibaculum sp.]
MTAPAKLKPDDFYTEAEVAAILRRRPQTLKNWRVKGEGPPIFKIGRSDAALYPRAAFEAWVRARIGAA